MGVGEGKEGKKCLQKNPWILKILLGSEWGSWLAGLVEYYWQQAVFSLSVWQVFIVNMPEKELYS